MHSVGYIHGDLKPDNFTLGPEAPGYTGMRGIAIINLIDFGSAIREGDLTLPRASNPAFASIRNLLGHRRYSLLFPVPAIDHSCTHTQPLPKLTTWNHWLTLSFTSYWVTTCLGSSNFIPVCLWVIAAIVSWLQSSLTSTQKSSARIYPRCTQDFYVIRMSLIRRRNPIMTYLCVSSGLSAVPFSLMHDFIRIVVQFLLLYIFGTDSVLVQQCICISLHTLSTLNVACTVTQ